MECNITFVRAVVGASPYRTTFKRFSVGDGVLGNPQNSRSLVSGNPLPRRPVTKKCNIAFVRREQAPALQVRVKASERRLAFPSGEGVNRPLSS